MIQLNYINDIKTIKSSSSTSRTRSSALNLEDDVLDVVEDEVLNLVLEVLDVEDAVLDDDDLEDENHIRPVKIGLWG